MFIWDFVGDTFFEQITKWIYSQIMIFLSEFFGMINSMGAELFDFVWVKAILLFFNYLAWAMFTVGLILTVFETAIAYQSGQGNVGGTFLNILKGFIATSLLTTLPVELFRFSVTMQTSLTASISGLISETKPIGEIAQNSLLQIDKMGFSGIFLIFLLIALGYSVIKVFFSNLKRGGILLTQIAIGSLYMVSIPRGFTDGFTSWSKQVIALSMTTFLQSLILITGLLVFKDKMLIGIGLMLSANEIPRIADQFGLETSTRGNMMSALYATQTLKNLMM